MHYTDLNYAVANLVIKHFSVPAFVLQIFFTMKRFQIVGGILGAMVVKTVSGCVRLLQKHMHHIMLIRERREK